MATASSQYEYDFYIISDDKDWEKNVIEGLEKKREGIRCISSKDFKPGNFKVDNWIGPINESQKVIIGFTSESHPTGEMEYITAHVIEEMMSKKRKFIPVKITRDAAIPDSLKAVTVANEWDDNIYKKLLDELDDGNNYVGDLSDKKPTTKDDVNADDTEDEANANDATNAVDDQEREENKTHKNEEDESTAPTCRIHFPNFYCQTCKHYLCKHCPGYVVCSKKHDVTKKKDAVRNFNTKVAEVKKTAEEMNKKLNEKHKTIDEDKKNFKAYLKLCTKAIENEEKDIIEKVKETSKKIMKNLEKIAKERKEMVKNQVKEIDNLQKEVKGMLSSMDKMMNKPEQIKNFQSIERTMNKSNDKFDQSFEGKNITPNFIKSKKLNDVLNTEGFGKIIMNEGTYQVAKKNESLIVTKGQSFEVKFLSLAESKQRKLDAMLMNSLGKTSTAKIEDQGSGEYRIKSKCDEDGEWQMKITVDDVHIKGSPVNIKVEKLGLVQTINNVSKHKRNRKKKEITDVMLGKDGCILVSRNSRDLLKFKKSGSFVECIKLLKDHVNRMYKMSNDQIIYSDCKGQRVVICDDKFQEIRSFSKEVLKHPMGLTVNETTRILYVADREAHCVYKFNIDDGSLLGKIGSEGSEESQMKEPTDVTLTKDGHVIVTDFTNDKTQVFDADDNFIEIIVKGGEEDGKILKPGGVVIDTDENIVISSNHKLQLFDKNGIFKKRIDDEDDGLNFPSGICFLSDRQQKVAVANNEEDNIKIFNY